LQQIQASRQPLNSAGVRIAMFFGVMTGIIAQRDPRSSSYSIWT
jgi:hypothetical protein